MKKAAIRYAEILEAGAWVTHQEQEDIAKFLRRLAMTEDEAWDELERKQNKKCNTTDMAHSIGGMTVDVTDLINRFIKAEREACAKHYLGIMRDAVEQAVLREREACANVCEQIIKESEINYKESYFGKKQRLFCLEMIAIPMKNAAAAIRARGDKHE